MTKELGILGGYLRRIAKENLGLKPYKSQRQQLHSSASKQNRFDRGKKILEEMKCATDNVKFFIVVDYENDRVYTTSSE